MAKIAVIGAGNWGTTLAILLASNNYEVFLWAREGKLAEEIGKNRENAQYLPNVKLHDKIRITHNLKHALENAEIVVTAIPSKFLRETAKSMSEYVKKGAMIVSVSKGLEETTLKRMSQILEEELNDSRVVVLSGPNIAHDISRNMLAATVVASMHAEALNDVCKAFTTPHFKVFKHDDVVGVEVCGALKNITAIAIGICDGLHLGDSAKGSIMTLGLREMIRFGKRFGAKEHTFYGLAGVGDLITTCTSRHSRNHFVGQKLAKGKNFDEIRQEMHGMVAEGVFTTKAVVEYAKKNKIEMPLAEHVYKVLYEKKDLKEAIRELLDIL